MASKKDNKKDVKKETKEEIEVIEVKSTEDNKTKRKNIFVYFLIMLAVFSLIDLAMISISLDLSDIVTYFKFGDDIILEVFYAILVLIVMLLFKNSYVFTNRQEKLFNSLLLAAPLILFSTILLVINVSSINLLAPEVLTFKNVFSVMLLCGLIGITEEFLCRGWLQNEFLERYGDTKKNIITSILLASFIFGIMHIVNVITTSQNFFETILQVVNAMSIGFLFGILYYKTKNIWSVIILHAYYDFSIMISNLAIVKDCTYGVATSKIMMASSFSTLMISAFWVICGLLILKRVNFPDERAVNSQTKLKNFYFLMLPLLALTFILSFIPFENMIDDYDDYRICYNYTELKLDDNYTIHYPYYSKYTISDDSAKSSYVMDDDNIHEVITVGKYDYELYIEDGMPIIKNINTKTEYKLSEERTYNLSVIENGNKYYISFISVNSSFEEHVHFSDFMNKEEFSNSDDYLEMIANSFRSIELPEVDKLAYLTIEGKNDNYPAFVTNDKDLFAIIDDDLYLIKK